MQAVQFKLLDCGLRQCYVRIVGRIERAAKNADSLGTLIQTQSRRGKNSLVKRSSWEPASNCR